jgi:hypothetical protein
MGQVLGMLPKVSTDRYSTESSINPSKIRVLELLDISFHGELRTRVCGRRFAVTRGGCLALALGGDDEKYLIVIVRGIRLFISDSAFCQFDTRENSDFLQSH